MSGAQQLLHAGHTASQHKSPLYSKLPGEVRDHIFAFALADYPDPDPAKQYDSMTCYARPSYFAPRTSDTQLLRTCRAVYKECWHLPFALREQTAWLTNPDRAPKGYDSGQLQLTLKQIADFHGSEKVEIRSLRVFAQMFMMEENRMAQLLSVPCLNPREITLTIRHADWWYWEDDEPSASTAIG